MKTAIYAFPGVTMFHLSVPQMVFDEVSRLGLADWSSARFSERAGSIRTAEGYAIGGIQSMAAVAGADLVIIPSWLADGRAPSTSLRDAIVAAHSEGAVVAASS